MTTQTVEPERIVYTEEFLQQLKRLGIEIPKYCIYRDKAESED